MKACIRVVFFYLLGIMLWVHCPPVFAIEVGDDIAADTVWTLHLSPYTVTADIIVSEGATLVIEPGVLVQFASGSSTSEGYSLIVEGTLTAVGSSDQPIVFTAEDTDSHWEYIEFAETSEPWDEVAETGSILDHCIVEYGGNGSDGEHGQAAIIGTSAAVTLTNSIVRYSKSGGILCYGSIAAISGNRIHDTETGITLLEPLAARITNNYLIENNQGIAVDSAAYGLDISNNTVVAASEEGYGSCLLLNLLFNDRLASYHWKLLTDNEAVSLNDATAIYPEFTVPALTGDEQFVFQLTVTSMDGLVDVDTVTINASWENQDPVANAGEDQEVTEGDLVTLDASDSFDNDDGIVSWVWEQTSGPDVTLDTSTGTMQAGFTAPSVDGSVDDILIFQVTVEDAGGNVNSDTMVVRVSDSFEYPQPIADAGPPQSVTEGNLVTLQGNLGNPVGDNVNVVSWFWKQTEGDYVALSGVSSQNATFQVDEVDANGKSYTFELTVTDDQMQQSTDTVIVNILDDDDASPNAPPTASVAAVGDVSEDSETDVILDATGSSDPESGVLTYSWAQIAGTTVTLTNTGTDGEQKFAVPDVNENETLTFRLTVTDEGDLRDTYEISVTILWVNEGPIAEAGDPQAVNEGDKVLLDGSSSSDDHGITSYQWTQQSGTVVSLFNDDASKCYFTAPDVTEDEFLVFTLTVGDGEFTRSDEVIVTVIADDENPVADAGNALVVAYESEVTLDGSGSYDPEAVAPVTGITSYVWEQVFDDDDEVIDDISVTLYDADTATPYFTAPAQDEDDYITLAFQLTVEDEDGQQGVDTVVVNITTDPTGTPPVAQAGPDQTVSENEVVTLTAAGSSDPNAMPELTVTGNHFSMDDESEEANALAVTEEEDSNTDLSITGNSFEKIQGNYLLYLYGFIDTTSALTLTDNAWGETTSEAIAQLIYDGSDAAHLPPVTFEPFAASIADAGATVSYPPMAAVEDDMTVDPDDPVTLDGTGTYDPDGLLSYRWEQTGGKTVTLSGAETAMAGFNTPAITDEDEEGDETLIFRLTVTDSSGFSDSKEIEVTITTDDDEDEGSFGSSGCFIGSIVGYDTL